MTDSMRDRHEHEHTHADGTTHSHPHSHGAGEDHQHEHAHAKPAAGNPQSNDLEIARELAAGEGAADLPPSPAQQGDGQEAGTARPENPREQP